VTPLRVTYRTGVGDAVAGYIRDTVDGTGGFAARADLSYFCHRKTNKKLKIKNKKY